MKRFIGAFLFCCSGCAAPAPEPPKPALAISSSDDAHEKRMARLKEGMGEANAALPAAVSCTMAQGQRLNSSGSAPEMIAAATIVICAPQISTIERAFVKAIGRPEATMQMEKFTRKLEAGVIAKVLLLRAAPRQSTPTPAPAYKPPPARTQAV